MDKNWRPTGEKWDKVFRDAGHKFAHAYGTYINSSHALFMFEAGASAIIPEVRAATLKEVGSLLADILISGNAVANELKIVEIAGAFKRGNMPEEVKHELRKA